MRKANKFIALGLLSVFVVGNAVFSLAFEKNAKHIPLEASAIKGEPLLLHKEQTLNFLSPYAANPKISGRLNSLISQKTAAEGEVGKLSINETGYGETGYGVFGKDSIRVIFNTIDGFSVNLDEIETHGGKILKERYNLVAVEVPIDKIEDIVNNVDGIEYARLPHKFFPLDVTSEGVNLTGANNLHSAGFTGTGVKVAVMDVGFKGLSGAQLNGDLPYSVETCDYTGTGLQKQYKHGTGCAEIVHDMAPDAELHLLKVADEVDIYNALDYCINNDIDIISSSIGSVGFTPGNGTGPEHDACDEARANGILVVNAAGNEANFTHADGTPVGAHWKGTFFDSDADGIHEFIPGDLESWYNAIGAVPHQDDDGNPKTNDVFIVMRWNDWLNTSIDYDIYLLDYFTGALVASSTAIQNGSQPPLEYIVRDLPDSENYIHFYALIVTKKSGEPAGTELELHLGGTSLFVPFYKYSSPIATSSSSLCEPADAQSVLAVGAINYSNWATGPQEDFSSQGPTNAWAGSSARIKPDICGPDGVSGYTYGAFFGTSAATPHVAGAAALILSMHPYLSPDELQSVIESNAIDMGSGGKDNLYGWGRLNVTVYNNSPVLNSIEEKSIDENQTLSFSIDATDPDHDCLTYSASNLPAGASFDPGTRTFSWTPTYEQGNDKPTTYPNIHFEVSDGFDTDSEDITITVNDVNRPPVLEWTGEADYESDGLEPETGYSTTNFTFKIKYIDADGQQPLVRKVYIDKNGDGDYVDSGEANDMTASGSDYASGVIYSYTTTIPYSSGGQNCSYYFGFSDGIDFATGNITQAINEGTAINKPDVSQTLGISIDKNSWGITPVPIQIPAPAQVMSQAERIKVTNSGDGLQTFALRIQDEDNKDEWVHSPAEDSAALNTYVLSAIFCGASDIPVSPDYNEGASDDVLNNSSQLANGTKFAYSSGSENGQSVGALNDIYLYFELDLPTSVSGAHFDEEHKMTVELSCQGE